MLEAVLPLLPDHFLEYFDEQTGGRVDLLQRFDGLRHEAGELLEKAREAERGRGSP